MDGYMSNNDQYGLMGGGVLSEVVGFGWTFSLAILPFFRV